MDAARERVRGVGHGARLRLVSVGLSATVTRKRTSGGGACAVNYFSVVSPVAHTTQRRAPAQVQQVKELEEPSKSFFPAQHTTAVVYLLTTLGFGEYVVIFSNMSTF